MKIKSSEQLQLRLVDREEDDDDGEEIMMRTNCIVKIGAGERTNDDCLLIDTH